MVGQVGVNSVEPAGLTKLSAIKFHVAGVGKPLASGVSVVVAGNRVVLQPTKVGSSYIENIDTSEKMLLKQKKGTYVFDVVYEETGERDEVTLDTGAGVSVWPKDKLPQVKMHPKKKGLKMVAANGSEIQYFGQKAIQFRGREIPAEEVGESLFTGPTR